MASKYKFKVSFNKTIIANDEDEALKILQGKLQHISEKKQIEREEIE